jgi:hypothetical protein
VTNDKYELTRSIIHGKDIQEQKTYAAVAANTSCLFAFVHKLNAIENAIVNRKIINILRGPVSVVQNSAMTGAIRSMTARKVMIRREKTSMRFFEYSRTSLSDVLLRSRLDMKSRFKPCQFVREQKNVVTSQLTRVTGPPNLDNTVSTRPSNQLPSFASTTLTKSLSL